MNTKQFFYTSPIGEIGIVALDNAITEIYFKKENQEKNFTIEETPLLQKANRQLKEYFNGTRKNFDLPLAPKGTAFQQKVWNALRQIPYGETRSYKQIAEMVDIPKGSRAIGNANNKNPIAIVIPCHRVIGANGKLVGYAGGIDIKISLLQLENCI